MKKLLALLLLASACWGQTIRTSGSRLTRTDAEWATLSGKKTGTAAEQFQWSTFVNYMTNYCSNPAGMAVNGGNASLCTYAMALAWKLDPATYGDAYADKACALLKYAVDWNDGDTGGILDTIAKIDNGDTFRWNAPPFARSYAILESRCDAIDTTVGDTFRDYATRVWNYYKPTSLGGTKQFLMLTTPYQVAGNIGVGQVNSVVQTSLAAFNASTFTTPQSWLTTIMSSVMTPYVLPCLLNSTAAYNYETCFGSSLPEGMAEYGPETIQLMMELLDSWRVGTTDVDYWPALSGVFPEYAADWLLLAGTSPTGPQGPQYKLYQPFLYRDVRAPAGSDGYGYYVHYMKYAVDRMRNHLARIGDTTRAQHLQYWLQNMMPAYLINTSYPSNTRSFYAHFLLYDDPNYTATDWRVNPNPLDLTTPYMLLSRSDWTEDATWFGITAMQEGINHSHGDAGAFNIWRKGKWLTRERPGYLHHRNVNPTSLHNSLTLNGHGSNGAIRSSMADVGFARVKRRTGGYMATANTVYSAAEFDLTPVYKFSAYLVSPDVDTVTRDIIYLKPDIFVVADRIKYLAGVTGFSIAHVQSEKGAASISGNRATISNASQRLHVHKVFPSTADFITVQESTCKVLEVRIRSNDSAAMFTDCAAMGNNGATYSVTLSGGQAEYAVLNGTHTMLNQLGNSGLEVFQDGGGISTGNPAGGYSAERFILNSTGLFAGLPAYDPATHGYLTTSLTRNVQWNDPDVNPLSPGLNITHDPYRLDIHSGRKVNEESFLVVMQGADSTDTPMTVATLTSTTSNATGAAFTPPGGSLTEVIAPTLTTPTYPMCITRTGDPADHYVLGQTPGTTYKVSDSANVTCINTSGAGTDVVANNAGILGYQVDASISTPSITLVATPASLTFNCTEGGQSPFPQTVELTATGNSGEAAVSFSSDQSWATAALSGGSAPQDTPQTMTVNIDCTGRAAGVHTATITITSATPYVVNSPTVGITLNVTAAALLAASPTSVTFAATLSGGNPANQTLAISRTSPGDLGTITNDSAGGWLTVSPTTATYTTQQNLTLSVDITGLTAGLYTANISIPSAGASNTPLVVPVTFGLNPAVQIGLEPQVGTDRVRVRYRAPSREACTVRACTDDSCDTEIASQSDGGGHPLRDFTLSGLTEDTPATLQTVCGTEIKARQIRTKVAGGPTRSFPLDLTNTYGATTISVKYGATSSMTETEVTGGCSAGRCTATITWPNANRIIYFQPLFKDIGGATIHTGPVQSQLLVP